MWGIGRTVFSFSYPCNFLVLLRNVELITLNPLKKQTTLQRSLERYARLLRELLLTQRVIKPAAHREQHIVATTCRRAGQQNDASADWARAKDHPASAVGRR